MAVVVLMYHHTPDGEPEGFYDVSLSRLRDQIGALTDAGASFIRFSQCGDPEFVERGVHVALTLDDGHASNAAAIACLADAGVTPTLFIVRDWSRADARYLSAGALADLKAVCELGGHGATHRALDRLDAAELAAELAASRDYVEAIAGARRDDGAPRRPRGQAGTRGGEPSGLCAGGQFAAAAASANRAQRQPHLR